MQVKKCWMPWHECGWPLFGTGCRKSSATCRQWLELLWLYYVEVTWSIVFYTITSSLTTGGNKLGKLYVVVWYLMADEKWNIIIISSKMNNSEYTKSHKNWTSVSPSVHGISFHYNQEWVQSFHDTNQAGPEG
jgi:cbb3-type cytochrome oxidase subunit 1